MYELIEHFVMVASELPGVGWRFGCYHGKRIDRLVQQSESSQSAIGGNNLKIKMARQNAVGQHMIVSSEQCERTLRPSPYDVCTAPRNWLRKLKKE